MRQVIRYTSLSIGLFALYCDWRALCIVVQNWHHKGVPPDLLYWLVLAASAALLSLSMAFTYRNSTK
jgi:hypothetical protein